MEDLDFDIRDYSHNAVSPELTVAHLYEKTKLRMLQVYTCSKVKVLSLTSDDSSESELRNERPKKGLIPFYFYFDTCDIIFIL